MESADCDFEHSKSFIKNIKFVFFSKVVNNLLLNMRKLETPRSDLFQNCLWNIILNVQNVDLQGIDIQQHPLLKKQKTEPPIIK